MIVVQAPSQPQWFIILNWLDNEEWGDEPPDPDDCCAVGDRVTVRGSGVEGTVCDDAIHPFLGSYLLYISVHWDDKLFPSPVEPSTLVRLTRYVPPDLTWTAIESFGDEKATNCLNDNEHLPHLDNIPTLLNELSSSPEVEKPLIDGEQLPQHTTQVVELTLTHGFDATILIFRNGDDQRQFLEENISSLDGDDQRQFLEENISSLDGDDQRQFLEENISSLDGDDQRQFLEENISSLDGDDQRQFLEENISSLDGDDQRQFLEENISSLDGDDQRQFLKENISSLDGDDQRQFLKENISSLDGDDQRQFLEENISSRKRRRCKGDGSGCIYWRTVTKKGKEYQEAYYQYEFWNNGNAVIKSTKYIPKRLLTTIQELESQKAPVREILKLLGVSDD
jgi:rubrerythrin